MKALVIYESTYGSTKAYAHLLAEQLHCPLIRMRDVDEKELQTCDLVLFGSCILGGKLYDADALRRWMIHYPHIDWILFTVGLVNPNMSDFNKLLEQFFDPALLAQLKTFHFRGAVRYGRIDVMSNLAKNASDHPELPLVMVPMDEEDYDTIKQYGTTLDLSDAQQIQPLIAYVNENYQL